MRILISLFFVMALMLTPGASALAHHGEEHEQGPTGDQNDDGHPDCGKKGCKDGGNNDPDNGDDTGDGDGEDVTDVPTDDQDGGDSGGGESGGNNTPNPSDDGDDASNTQRHADDDADDRPTTPIVAPLDPICYTLGLVQTNAVTRPVTIGGITYIPVAYCYLANPLIPAE